MAIKRAQTHTIRTGNTKLSKKTKATKTQAKKKAHRSKQNETTQNTETELKLTTSGCTVLDLALGGGFAWGKVVNIIGDESTGKTLLTIETIASAFRAALKKLGWFWDDTERGYSFPDKAIWGIELVPDPELYSETIEEWMYNVRTRLQTPIEQGTPYIYVTDSLDGITTDAELSRADARDKAVQQGVREKGSWKVEKPRMLSEFFRILKGDISKSKCLFIVISQLRANLSGFGHSKNRAGGKALDFYATQIIELKILNKLRETYNSVERVTGVVLEAYVKKNKIWKPYRRCRFIVLFDYGIDDVDSNICFLFDLYDERTKCPKKVINVAYKNKQFKRRAALIRYIETNDLEDDIKELCQRKWNTIEAALSPCHRKPKR